MKVGIDLGGSHIGIGVVNENGIIVKKIEQDLKETEKKHIKEIIENTIIDNLKQIQKQYKIEEVGIAIPGTIEKNKVIKSVNLGLENYEIVNKIQERINLPIHIKNDAKCAAMAENTYGCLKGYKRSIFLTLGTGIGGAIIIDNKLLDTGNLPGCEFGHLVIKKGGKKCKCGRNGCFEQYASIKVLKNNLIRKLKYDKKTTGKEIVDIIKNTTSVDKDYIKIRNILMEYIEDLSIGIANLINIFEPEVIGIGGSFVYFKEILLEPLKKSLLESNKLFNPKKEINIKTAILKNDAGIIGSIL